MKRVVDIHKTIKDYKTIKYYLIKNDVKVRYEIEDGELELELDE
jgi:hypothetical protein